VAAEGHGRARVGSGKDNHWTGGGVAFPPIPRSFAQKINKKVKAQAFRMALGDLVNGGTVRVLAGETWTEPSTKKAFELIEKADLQRPLLVLVSNDELDALKSFRNLAGHPRARHRRRRSAGLRVAKSLLFTEAAVSFLEGGLTDGGEA